MLEFVRFVLLLILKDLAKDLAKDLKEVQTLQIQ